MTTSYKLLPVISDYCTGCRICVDSCEHDCLEMEWDFSTMNHPDLCHSDGVCMRACPENAIRMEWVECAAEHTNGQWCAPSEVPVPPPPEGFWQRLFGRDS